MIFYGKESFERRERKRSQRKEKVTKTAKIVKEKQYIKKRVEKLVTLAVGMFVQRLRMTLLVPSSG